jgi:hypothetical protein
LYPTSFDFSLTSCPGTILGLFSCTCSLSENICKYVIYAVADYND